RRCAAHAGHHDNGPDDDEFEMPSLGIERSVLAGRTRRVQMPASAPVSTASSASVRDRRPAAVWWRSNPQSRAESPPPPGGSLLVIEATTSRDPLDPVARRPRSPPADP